MKTLALLAALSAPVALAATAGEACGALCMAWCWLSGGCCC